jgi:hypothetical protein
MQTYEIEVDGQTFEIEADSPNDIPKIVSKLKSLTTTDKKSFFTKPEREFGKRVKDRITRYEQPTIIGEKLGLKQGTALEGIAGTPERLLRSIGGAVGTIGDFASMEALQGVNVFDESLGRFPSELTKETIGGLAKLTKGLRQNKVYKTLADLSKDYLKQVYTDYSSLDPSIRADIGSIGDIGMGLPSSAATLGIGKKAIETKLGEIAIKKDSKNIADVLKSEIEETSNTKTLSEVGKPIPKYEDMTAKEVSKAKEFINDLGEKVSLEDKRPKFLFRPDDVLDAEEAAVFAQKKAEMTNSPHIYAKASIAHTKNPLQNDSPSEIWNKKAVEAFEYADSLRKKIGEEKSDLLKANNDKKLSIIDLKAEFTQKVNERFGNLAKGEVHTDPSAIPAIEEIREHFKNTNKELYMEDADRFKQSLQNMVTYDKNGEFRTANSKLNAIVKEITYKLEKRIEKNVEGLAEKNKAYAEYKNLEDAFSKALGSEAVKGLGLTKHGSSIMKRGVQSIANSNLKTLFKEIKRLTGGKYDLIQDANYALVTMRLSGDKKQMAKALSFPETVGENIYKGLQRASLETIAIGKLVDIAKKKHKKQDIYRVLKWYDEQQAKHKTENKE